MGERLKEKRCSLCRETKPLGAFSPKGNKYQSACKGCRSERRRELHAANCDEINRRRRKRRKHNIEELRQKEREAYAANPEVKRKATRGYRQRNLEKVRRRERAARYGLRPNEIDAILRAQNNQCGICGTPNPPADKLGRRWNLDHDHVTGRVRGVLCRRCNLGIGFLSDDPARCLAAASYLQRADV